MRMRETRGNRVTLQRSLKRMAYLNNLYEQHRHRTCNDCFRGIIIITPFIDCGS